MISKEEIQNLAQLARLELSDAEVGSLQKDISNILEYVGQLSAEETASASLQDIRGRSAEAVSSALLVRNVMRDDTPRGETDPLAHTRDAVVNALPTREGDYNVVRKIIQKDE